MSQDKDLSSLFPVVPDPGKYQWVKGRSSGTDDKEKDHTYIRRLRWLASFALVLGLGACAQGGSPPKVWPAVPVKPLAPPVAPQVAYRIDEHRYFEITPWPDGECAEKMLYFVDTAKGIRSKAVQWDNVMTQGTFIIDAANDQYLVAPATRGGINCSSGGGRCAAATMPYSIDGGRTWRRVWSPGTTYDLRVSGATAYQSHRNVDVITEGLDLTLAKPQSSDWTYLPRFVFKPRIAPVDTKMQCKAQDSGSGK